MARGEYAVGMTACRQLLTLEPWLEVAHRHLMTLLTASGMRTQALQQYAICHQTLADELGVEPLPETTALYAQIKAGDHTHKPIVDRPYSFGEPCG